MPFLGGRFCNTFHVSKPEKYRKICYFLNLHMDGMAQALQYSCFVSSTVQEVIMQAFGARKNCIMQNLRNLKLVNYCKFLHLHIQNLIWTVLVEYALVRGNTCILD